MQEEKLIRDFVDYLHEHNIQEYVKLPQIAVMGDTSSGKSSLLSATSNIELPSSHTLTTRCPTRLHMSKSKDGSYSAKIGITWHVSSSYKLEASQTYQSLLNGRDSLVDIAKCISEAQEFIIKTSKKDVAFDVVEVALSTPDSFDLTLIDLPGIVRIAGADEKASIVDDIQALNQEYLTNERCIILAVVPANVDFHNSQILADASKVDPKTERTIPVITKADAIDEGAEGGVMELLEGRKTHKFNRGFHIVKCRNQASLDKGVTIARGIEEEELFFRVKDPWKSLNDREQFGIPNLRKKLADLQIEMLKNGVPCIIEEIKSKRNELIVQLDKLGIDLEDDFRRRDLFTKLVKDFILFIVNNVEGTRAGKWIGEKDFTLRALIEEINTQFRDNIMSSKLSTIENIPKAAEVTFHTKNGDIKATVVDFNKDSDNNITEYFLQPVDENDNKIITFYSNINMYYDVSPSLKDGEVRRDDGRVVRLIKTDTTKEKLWIHAYHPFTRGDFSYDNSKWILEKIKRCRNHHLPIFLSSEVFNSIVDGFVREDWVKHVQCFLNSHFSLLKGFVTNAIDSTLSGCPSGLLNWMKRIVHDVVSSLESSVFLKLMELLDDEANQIYTQNHYLYENINKRRKELFLQKVKYLFSSTVVSTTKTKISSISPDATITLAALENVLAMNDKMSCEEHAAQEMEIGLMAYGRVAGKRVIDAVPKCFEREYVAKLVPLFETRFKLTDVQLAELLVESEAVINKRKKLRSAVELFTEAENAIDKLFNVSIKGTSEQHKRI
jgi:GTPase SAR1 family protein